MKFFARLIMIIIIPVFIWLLFSYLGGMIDLSDFLKRAGALVVAAFVMYQVSISDN